MYSTGQIFDKQTWPSSMFNVKDDINLSRPASQQTDRSNDLVEILAGILKSVAIGQQTKLKIGLRIMQILLKMCAFDKRKR